MNGKPYSHYPKPTPLEAANTRITDLEAQLSDWKALHTAIATGQPIWPNNWAQEVAMLAYEFDVKNSQIEAAKKDSALLDFLENQQDVSYQDHDAHWIGVDGGNIRYFLEMQKAKLDAAIQAKEAA